MCSGKTCCAHGTNNARFAIRRLTDTWPMLSCCCCCYCCCCCGLD
jgi:hypothetical protein